MARRRLLDWLRRRRPPAIGRWLADTYCEPPSTSFMVLGRRELKYRLYLPSNVRPPTPLLIMLHGCGQTAEEFAQGTRMNAAAERHHCAVLYPEQSRQSNVMRCWNWFDPAVHAGAGDAGLIIAVLRHVMALHPIDPARIYVAGLSAGGAMAAVLCATHADVFAAGAIHSGLMYRAASGAMDAMQVMRRGSTAALQPGVDAMMAGRHARLVPLLVIHGNLDTTVAPINAEQLVQQALLLSQGLNPQREPSMMSAERPLEAGGRRYRQRDLVHDSAVVLRSILIDGLGHAWSGGEARHEFFDPAGPDASSLILDFLLTHRLPATSTDRGPATSSAPLQAVP